MDLHVAGIKWTLSSVWNFSFVDHLSLLHDIKSCSLRVLVIPSHLILNPPSTSIPQDLITKIFSAFIFDPMLSEHSNKLV
jgi:hypothetical protein